VEDRRRHSGGELRSGFAFDEFVWGGQVVKRIIAGVASLLILAIALSFAPPPEREVAANAVGEFWVKLVFGLDGRDASWNGSLDVSAGRVIEMAEWCFEERDRIDAEKSSWTIQTGIPAEGRTSFAEPQRGLLVKVTANRDTEVHVRTGQGDFTFRPMELSASRPLSVAEGRAAVERLGTEQIVARTETDDDFPSLAIDAQGGRHVAWIAYDHTDQRDALLVRSVDEAGSRPEEAAPPGEFSEPHLFAMPDGALRLVYCAADAHGNWDVYTAQREKDGWRSTRITSAPGNDLHLAADLAGDGTLWIAWQSFRAGNADIFAKYLSNGEWSEDIAVATSPANEWEPSISVDAQGRGWIGYDSYQHGNYDVFLTSLRRTRGAVEVARPISVTTSEDFEAHASVLAEGNGRVWIAYDAAGPNWGKDFRNIPTTSSGWYAEPLHASRRVELRLVANGSVQRPTDPLPQILPPERIERIERKPGAKPTRFYEFPRLARGGNGRIWLLFRECRQGYASHPPKGACWRICATTYTGEGWLPPIELPQSWGRQNQRVSCALGQDGALHCAWADGNRFASVNRKYVVHSGALPAVDQPAATIPCENVELPPPGVADPAPRYDWTVERGGKKYKLYFGDLHRHTNISRCSPTIDGCLTDAHRYALDAVEYDFLGITDHTRDLDPFSWWRTQKAADRFHVAGLYVPIFSYERSNNAEGGGHRNVFFLNRGNEVSRSDAWYSGRNLPPQDTNPETTLYPWLKKIGGALTAAHTPVHSAARDRGTWTFNDPQVEPIAEIFQGCRQSYERPGPGVAEQASLWFALKKGHRLGFIASSDHFSTHMSYACVWATEKTRPALFEALAARRTFAATDRIALGVWVGEAFMGEETEIKGDVTLRVLAQGTAPIREVDVVRTGEVIFTYRPDRARMEWEYTDPHPLTGTSSYYVRLVQHDGAIAWGSPIWVHRTEP